MSGETPHQQNPILHAPREGVDYVTCWRCPNAYTLASGEHDSLASDAAWCDKWEAFIDDPHEHLTSDDAACWGLR